MSAPAWALVPVKRLALAKSRLAPHLGAAERKALQCAMFFHVVAELQCVRGLSGVGVVSADPEVEAMCAGQGVVFIPETGADGLNQALSQGTAALSTRGAGLIAVIPADLPDLVATDVERAVAFARETNATLVVPDRAGSGTNGLIFPAEHPPRFLFGAGSFRRHLEKPGALPCPLPSLARDVDHPDDLATPSPCITCLEALS